MSACKDRGVGHQFVIVLDEDGNPTGDRVCIHQHCGIYVRITEDPKALPERDELLKLGRRWGHGVLDDSSIDGAKYSAIQRKGHVELSLADCLYLRDELVPLLLGMVLRARRVEKATE